MATPKGRLEDDSDEQRKPFFLLFFVVFTSGLKSLFSKKGGRMLMFLFGDFVGICRNI